MKHIPIGLFYGSSTCYTEMAGEKIQQQFDQGQIEVFNIADTSIEKLAEFEHLILGIPTWDYGELQEDWEDCWDDLSDIDFTGKTIAIFGLGDQVGYPEWFLDAMGYLHNKLVAQGARAIGYWPNEGYQYDESQALTEDKKFFVGLALDDENEFNKTDERISIWCEQIKREFASS